RRVETGRRHQRERRGVFAKINPKRRYKDMNFADETHESIVALRPLGPPPGSKYDRLVARAKSVPPAITVVVYPCDETSLRGTVEAAEIGIIVPILVGPAKKIAEVARAHNLQIGKFQIVDVPHAE